MSFNLWLLGYVYSVIYSQSWFIDYIIILIVGGSLVGKDDTSNNRRSFYSIYNILQRHTTNSGCEVPSKILWFMGEEQLIIMSGI